MLVLGLAGIMLALVFSSLPGLYATARNQSRMKDAQNLSIALSSYLANNSFNYPDSSNYSDLYSSTTGGGTKWASSGLNLGPETNQGGIYVFNSTTEIIKPNINSIWVFKQSLCPTNETHNIAMLRTNNVSILRFAIVIKLEVSNNIYCVNN